LPRRLSSQSQIGGQGEMMNGAHMRPFAQLGVAIYTNTDFSLGARFENETLGMPSFTTVTDLDTVRWMSRCGSTF
jgi:hypothetical protein